MDVWKLDQEGWGLEAVQWDDWDSETITSPEDVLAAATLLWPSGDADDLLGDFTPDLSLLNSTDPRRATHHAAQRHPQHVTRCVGTAQKDANSLFACSGSHLTDVTTAQPDPIAVRNPEAPCVSGLEHGASAEGMKTSFADPRAAPCSGDFRTLHSSDDSGSGRYRLASTSLEQGSVTDRFTDVHKADLQNVDGLGTPVAPPREQCNICSVPMRGKHCRRWCCKECHAVLQFAYARGLTRKEVRPRVQARMQEGFTPDAARLAVRRTLKLVPASSNDAQSPTAEKWQCAMCGLERTPMRRNHTVHGPKSVCNKCAMRVKRENERANQGPRPMLTSAKGCAAGCDVVAASGGVKKRRVTSDDSAGGDDSAPCDGACDARQLRRGTRERKPKRFPEAAETELAPRDRKPKKAPRSVTSEDKAPAPLATAFSVDALYAPEAFPSNPDAWHSSCTLQYIESEPRWPPGSGVTMSRRMSP